MNTLTLNGSESGVNTKPAIIRYEPKQLFIFSRQLTKLIVFKIHNEAWGVVKSIERIVICSQKMKGLFKTRNCGKCPKQCGSAPFQNSPLSTEGKAMSQSTPLAKTCSLNHEKKVSCKSL